MYFQRRKRRHCQPILSALSEAAVPDAVRDSVGIYLDAAATLGRRTGELHVSLGQATTDEDFNPKPFTAADSEALREQLSVNAARAFEALKDNLANLPDELVESAGLVLSRRRTLFETLSELTKNGDWRPSDARSRRLPLGPGAEDQVRFCDS